MEVEKPFLLILSLTFTHPQDQNRAHFVGGYSGKNKVLYGVYLRVLGDGEACYISLHLSLDGVEKLIWQIIAF